MTHREASLRAPGAPAPSQPASAQATGRGLGGQPLDARRVRSRSSTESLMPNAAGTGEGVRTAVDVAPAAVCRWMCLTYARCARRAVDEGVQEHRGCKQHQARCGVRGRVDPGTTPT